MSDLIDRQAAKEAIRDKFKDLPSRCEINEVLNGLPSAQPEIIRCWDCKHYRATVAFVEPYCHLAEWYKRHQRDDDFCSRAERREDG